MKKYFILHPFLFALYPVLFLYAQNINQFKENVVITPITISLICASIIFLLCKLLSKNLSLSAIISSLLILSFLSFSRVRELIKNVNFDLGQLHFGSEEILILSLLFIFSIMVFLIVKYNLSSSSNNHRLKKVNKLLNILSLILIAITVFNITSRQIQMKRSFLASLTGNNLLSGFTQESNQLQSLNKLEQTPDIYYFVPDRYAGEKTLADYGFDNGAFLSFLKTKGFYIASQSTSNYPKTFLSLGSTLNMGYLDYLTQKTDGGATNDQSIVTPLVKNNKVVRFLKDKGYFYIHVGSGWDPTRSNKYADLNLVLKGGRYPFADEFTSGFLQTTIASPILKRLFPDTTAVSETPKNNEERSRTLYEFETFNQIPQIPGPKFVFTHILIPHDPYVLDKDCQPLPEKVISKRSEQENYLNQLQCANKKMEDVIEKILSQSQSKPIIIIQADEGPLPIKNPISSNLSWKNANDASLIEKFPILSAYLLPDLKANPLYPSITPVNSFRIIFNTYFGTNLPLLPDRNIIFEDDKNYYKFIDVTERVKLQ